MEKGIVLGVLSLLSALGRADAATVFEIDDYLALQGLSELSVSPDAKIVAYTLTSYDLKKDESRDIVWTQSVAGGEPLQMTGTHESAGNSSSPKWSPDGRYLAVLSDRADETSQVWLFDRSGGDPQQLTTLKQGVDAFEWSPDSLQMLLLAEDPTPADLDDEEKPNPRPYVIDRLQFKEDYVGYLDRYRTHIHVVNLKNRDVRQVTSGDFDDSEAAWSPDSRHIAFVSNRTNAPDRNRNTDLWLVDTNSSDAEPRQLTTQVTADASPAWSPDGRSIVYTSTNSASLPIYAIPQLTMLDMDSGQITTFPALREVQVFKPIFGSDGQNIFTITETHGEQNLVSIDAASGDLTLLLDGRDVVGEMQLGNNNTILALISRPDLPDEIFVLDDQGLRQLSNVNKTALSDISLATVEKHTFNSDDGTPIETFIMFPPEHSSSKQYPGILFVHGGPQAQWDFGFNSEAQLLASQGYVVVMPNPRGSFGYGQAFAEAIYQDWGGIDYEDVMAAIDFSIDKGWVDEDRMAVYGWSYGGMMTNHVITKTDRFKAAITGASATLYVTNYGHDQYQRWWEEELGLPWLAENRAKWDNISPFYALDKVKTPTLIVGGEDDWNVPIINSEQLYIGLKRQGIPTELVVYPGEGHVLSIPSYEKDLYERYFRWLQQYVK